MGYEAKISELRVEANERGEKGNARDHQKCPTKRSWWRFEEDYRSKRGCREDEENEIQE